MPAKKKTSPRKNTALFIPEKITPLVHVLRHEKVLLDSDLTELYAVPTKVLNQAVQRTLNRIPDDFAEQDVTMLSSVLRSPRAVEVKIAIMRTFVQLRRLMDSRFEGTVAKAIAVCERMRSPSVGLGSGLLP